MCCRGVSTPVSHSRGPGFKSRSSEEFSWLRLCMVYFSLSRQLIGSSPCSYSPSPIHYSYINWRCVTWRVVTALLNKQRIKDNADRANYPYIRSAERRTLFCFTEHTPYEKLFQIKIIKFNKKRGLYIGTYEIGSEIPWPFNAVAEQ
jgi:hypothetical protein